MNEKVNPYIEFLGWDGAVSLLVGYHMIQIKKVKHDNKLYILLNIFGATSLAINTFYHNAYPSFITNSLWALFGLFGYFINKNN